MRTSQFDFLETTLDDVFIIQKSKFEDDRGSLIKSYNKEAFDAANLRSDFK